MNVVHLPQYRDAAAVALGGEQSGNESQRGKSCKVRRREKKAAQNFLVNNLYKLNNRHKRIPPPNSKLFSSFVNPKS
jgi:hypothetical protein